MRGFEMRFDYDVWMTIHNMKLGVGEVGLIIITTNFGAYDVRGWIAVQRRVEIFILYPSEGIYT